MANRQDPEQGVRAVNASYTFDAFAVAVRDWAANMPRQVTVGDAARWFGHSVLVTEAAIVYQHGVAIGDGDVIVHD